MKTLVILFADSGSLHIFDKIFDGKSAFFRSLEWAGNVCALKDFSDSSEIIVFGFEKNAENCKKEISDSGINAGLVLRENWTVSELFESFSSLSKEKQADTVVYAWADCPFLNLEVTEEILSVHKESLAEYTFADGYPGGLCPEALDSGAASILFELSKNSAVSGAFSAGKKNVSRTSVFDLIKTDINSFEVETVIADNDTSLLRIELNCATKGNALGCGAMFKNGVDGKPAGLISEEACVNADVLKTVPAYYSVQITDKVLSKVIYHPDEMESLCGEKFMPLEDFKKIIRKIADFSETAVVSLSAWGEATIHPDFVEIVKAALSEPGLSVLVEGDCSELTEEMCVKLKNICDSASSESRAQEKPRIMWLVTLDAFSEKIYPVVHKSENPGNFEKSKASVALLQKYFPGNVYPQFTRMNENEPELEAFYRFWSDKDSPSRGNLTVQKYDSCCGTLPDRKPADLAPLERQVCWHLRRDMTILLNGDVPFSRGKLKSEILGNVLKENIEEIWKKTDSEVKNQINHDFSGKCGKCDEFYTFNF